jgi:hypothetical protein
MKLRWRKMNNVWFGYRDREWNDIAWSIRREHIYGESFRWVLYSLETRGWSRAYPNLRIEECVGMADKIEQGVYTLRKDDE